MPKKPNKEKVEEVKEEIGAPIDIGGSEAALLSNEEDTSDEDEELEDF